MNIGIIGFGHLGKALVAGLVKSGVPSEHIVINARSEKTIETAKSMYPNITVVRKKEELVHMVDVIVLVMEPQNAKGVLEELSTLAISDKAIISFMAGVKIADIRAMLHDESEKYQIIRMMPNVSIAHCNGIIGVTGQYDSVELQEIFAKLGDVIELDEEHLEYITIIAASGLAFAAYMMQAYMNASEKLLGDEEISKRITKKVFENVLETIDGENISFDELIARIATKGGTTEAGVHVLTQSDMGEIVEECFGAGVQRCNHVLEAEGE